MIPFDEYPGGGRTLLGPVKGANCRHEYGLQFMRKTGQTRCAYCSADFARSYETWLTMALDHVVPVGVCTELGIPAEWQEDITNKVLACAACNSFRNRYKPPADVSCPKTQDDFFDLRDRIFAERRKAILERHDSERAFFNKLQPLFDPLRRKYPELLPEAPERLIHDFRTVAELAGVRLAGEDISCEVLSAPHTPTSLPAGKMAVYVFLWGDRCLKVGKAGLNSGARYLSQHYNPQSCQSNLAKSLIEKGHLIDVTGLKGSNVKAWIKQKTTRINYLLDQGVGVHMLSLFEAFAQCCLKPKFEGFEAQA